MTGQDPAPPPEEPTGHTASVASGCSLLVLVPGALFWLWLRDRTGEIERQVVGTAGPWLALGVGAAVGFGIAGGLALLARYLPAYRRLEDRLQTFVGPLDDTRLLVVSFATALGEEVFFRLAALDALGLVGATVLYAAVNIGPRLWLWTGLAAVLGLGLGLLVEAGYGWLSAAAAHAIANQLTLRRILK